MVNEEKKIALIEEREKRVRELKMQLKQKMLREQRKRMLEIGGLVEKAEIAQMDNDVLLGAFLEIAEKSTSEPNLKKWRERAKEKKKIEEKLIVSFKNPPSLEIKTLLKEKKFRWNSFRGEYHGIAQTEELKSLLLNTDHKIEIVQ